MDVEHMMELWKKKAVISWKKVLKKEPAPPKGKIRVRQRPSAANKPSETHPTITS